MQNVLSLCKHPRPSEPSLLASGRPKAVTAVGQSCRGLDGVPLKHAEVSPNPWDVMLSRKRVFEDAQVGLHQWLSGKEYACNAGDAGLIPGSGRSPGGGHGNPLQYSCLENPMDRGAWWAEVHRVAKSQT